MKRNKMFITLKILSVVVVIIIIVYFAFGYFSSYIGWYGYEKWKYRVATSDIAESQKRGVFVKQLKYKIYDFPDTLRSFRPYIEKGFRYGHHSSEVTVPITNSNYPYQLCFNFKSSEKLGILIRKSELKKFDSADAVWGYLKYPILKDTIIVDIIGFQVKPGMIKIFE